jgi:hypothetical protein
MDGGPVSRYSLGHGYLRLERRSSSIFRAANLAMDENLKAPLVVFNLTVGLYMLFRIFTAKHMSMTFGAMFTHLLIGAAVGLVLGGITFFFTRKK